MLDPASVQAALLGASEEERACLQGMLEELRIRDLREKCQAEFMPFVHAQWPGFIEGEHHRRIAKLFEKIAAGELKRVIINLAPRHTKSEFASYLLPAWFLGKFPDKKVLQISNTAELAEGFGRKVRNLLDMDSYTNIFPDVELRADSKAAGRWNTNHNGDYYATGVGAALAGRGADLAIVDDPHTEQEALAAIFNPGVYDKTYEWYTSAVRQRLQPGGAIVIVMTRWSLRDLVGQILDTAATRNSIDQWQVFEFPAILPSGNPLWPEFWSLDELLAVKAEIPAGKWNAQYLQHPTSDETAIVKRAWWQRWEKPEPPECDYTLMSLDCAFEAKESADYSAMTYWGVWSNPEDGTDHVILLDAWRDKLEFPELKAKVLELYKEHEPDSIIIEKKASGAPLIYELRKMGIPAQEYTPTRKSGQNNDKIARLNAVADVFSSGKVWAPHRKWAEDVIDEIASFPAGRNDDYVDTTSQAIARIRKGGMVRTKLDKETSWEEEMMSRYRSKRYY